MIKIGGVVYRNIQEQVAKNTDDIAKIFRRPVLQVKMVEELPEEGEEGILYLLPATDPEIGNYYEEYLWIDSAWELIGSSAVDISNMVTTDTIQTITAVKTIADTGSANSPKLQFQNQYATLGIFANGYQLRTDAPMYVDGNLNVGNVVPAANGTKDLGSSSMRWKDIHLGGIAYFYGANYLGSITNKDNRIVITYGGADRLRVGNSDSDFATNLNPKTNSVFDLGSSTAKWKDIYMSGSIVFDTNTKIERNSNNQMLFYAGHSNPAMQITDTRTYFRKTIRPYSSGIDIGGTSEPWHDLYLNGSMSDGTNSVTIADLAALITYAKAQGWIS